MIIIRPRLNDFHNLPLRQSEVDFAMPFLNEDIPLYIDPFLLWKSPSQQDNSLHLSIVNSFNQLGHLYIKGKSESIENLVLASECNEVGLGSSKSKKGKRIGQNKAEEILQLFKQIPKIKEMGCLHIEEIQLLVSKIGEDRISDIAANFIKSFLIDYTIDQSEKLEIPIEKTKVAYYDIKKAKFSEEEVYLPINPANKEPIIFTPKRWLRYSNFINYEDYFKNYFHTEVDSKEKDRIKVLNYNRHNYDQVKTFISIKERSKKECKNDPLFKPIPVLSSKRKLKTIINLPTGKLNNADIEYENNLCPLLATLMYPDLDFAKEQSRTDSGVLIRDMIFYNNCQMPFLKEIGETYGCKQIVFELKNVKALENSHINQLNRYLKASFGNFGIIFTRHKPPKKVIKNTIDLWSGQRKCILILTDEDLKLMCQVFESKQRLPIEVVKRKYVEFTRMVPS